MDLRDDRGLLIQEFDQTDFTTLDPCDKLLRMQCWRLTDLLTELTNTDGLSVEHRKKMLPGQPYSGVVPQFYALPKIHKFGRLKIRPIVSNVDIYCDKLLIHLKAVLNLVFRGEHTVLNSYHFVNRLDQIQLDQMDRLASFDVVSLFRKVPVNATLDIDQTRLQMWADEDGRDQLEELTSLSVDGFMRLLRLVVMDFYFIWHGHLHKQVGGLPMGSRLSPVLANIIMEHLESTVFRNFPVLPKTYLRFVDDVFIIYNSDLCDLTALLLQFNSQCNSTNCRGSFRWPLNRGRQLGVFAKRS